MIRFLRKRNKYDWIAYSCYAFMIAVMVAVCPGLARAGDVQWNIQLHWQTPHHGPTTGIIGTPPHHNHRPQYPAYSYHNHPHFYSRYGWHYHQGRRYPVVYQYHNWRGELCREFEMEVNIGGRYELAWGVACRDYRGYWRLER